MRFACGLVRVSGVLGPGGFGSPWDHVAVPNLACAAAYGVAAVRQVFQIL